MICNGKSLLELSPIKHMIDHKVHAHGVSYGQGEAGYDVRIKQHIVFRPGLGCVYVYDPPNALALSEVRGRFTIASTIEEFDMPDNLVGVVHDKSTWARQGLSVFNTVIENKWKGFLTLELVYHGNDELIIPAGAGIAQVMFHHTQHAACYTGRYNHQADKPVAAKSAP